MKIIPKDVTPFKAKQCIVYINHFFLFPILQSLPLCREATVFFTVGKVLAYWVHI